MDRFIVVYETLGGKKKSEPLSKERAYEFYKSIRDTCLWAKVLKDCEASDTPAIRPEYIVTWKDSEGVHVQKRDDVTRAWFFYKSIEHCEWKKLTEEPSSNVLREFPIRPVVKVEENKSRENKSKENAEGNGMVKDLFEHLFGVTREEYNSALANYGILMGEDTSEYMW